ncbi:predicted nucleoside-diphosphate sugar epimerase [marine gamma proteobacterium HTCC2207]|uniref:Predicted nucleoside-diphosphate sugar epimerase n=1 Tax=gamma proteobacterium HTCC2207 TaxID=314287 RepID=Q1YPS7_9GAMM|nr:predicted nucleoside-diphosphate sugar epimerase [marine gamma proteobacterium HTCC2207] [gamma proteobacterium HTCC2207]
MNILYLDSFELSFQFESDKGNAVCEKISAFENIDGVISFFRQRLRFDLILYNPHIFMQLILNEDYRFEKYLADLPVRCLPYSNPKNILPIAQAIEDKLIDLFPLQNNEVEEAVDSYCGKCVLVTGAGGSIGSELVGQLIDNRVSKCICLDLSEFSVFNLKRKLASRDKDLVSVYVGSYGDKELLATIFQKYDVDLVINAAAYKHVSIMEDNPYAAFTNNVSNFLELLRSAKVFGVKDIIQISTDKAASPSSIMGFSKFLCEQLLANANRFMDADFRYSIVRFGNVVGSSGSVAPIFVDNIKNSHKLNITHRDVNRFMMKITDAVNLILLASRIRRNETYILDMGQAYKIIDVAQTMLKYTNFSFDETMLNFVGLEKGEKLSETLFTDFEKSSMKKKDKVFVLKYTPDSTFTDEELASIYAGNVPSLQELFSRIKL